MNKDLEIIKYNLTMLKGYTSDEADELLDDSIKVAENITAENERLKKALKYRDEVIAHLKAELEKRPEVVRCGECSNLVINDNAKYCGICLDAKRKRNDFCSRGQRRESEEGK